MSGCVVYPGRRSGHTPALQVFLDALGEPLDSARRQGGRGIYDWQVLNEGTQFEVDLVLLDERYRRVPLPCHTRARACTAAASILSDSRRVSIRPRLPPPLAAPWPPGHLMTRIAHQHFALVPGGSLPRGPEHGMGGQCGKGRAVALMYTAAVGAAPQSPPTWLAVPLCGLAMRSLHHERCGGPRRCRSQWGLPW